MRITKKAIGPNHYHSAERTLFIIIDKKRGRNAIAAELLKYRIQEHTFSTLDNSLITNEEIDVGRKQRT